MISTFILCNNNIYRIKKFIELINKVKNIDPIFIKINDDILNVKYELQELKKDHIFIYGNLNNLVDIFRKHVKSKYFIVTNININWNDKLKFDLRNFKHDFIKCTIYKCFKCYQKKSIIHKLKYFQGFSIIRTKCLEDSLKYINYNKTYLNIPFYTINSCITCPKHIYDLCDDIDEYDSGSFFYRSFPSLLIYDKQRWIELFNKHNLNYVKNIVNTVVNKEIIDNKLELMNDDRKMFNTPEFRIHQLYHKFYRDRLVVKFSIRDMVKKYGFKRVQLVKNIFENISETVINIIFI